MAFPSGHELQNGKYKIQKSIGKGGFGLTYLGLHTAFEAPIVLKTPNQELQDDVDYAKFVERFIKEGRTLWKLAEQRNPHIVRVTDLFEEKNLPFLVMDFIQGESLYDRVKRKGALPEAEVLGYLRQMGQALQVVHHSGLVHRDAHPGNIMILPPVAHKPEREAILIDFGIAGQAISSRVSTKFGNEAFAPCEQYVMNADPKMDVYTLAASAYYAITGKCPETSLQRKLGGVALTEPKRLNSRISDFFNRAIVSGMALEINDRPSLNQWLTQLNPSPIVTAPTVRIDSPPDPRFNVSPPPVKDPLVEGLRGMGRGLKNFVQDVLQENAAPPPAQKRSPQPNAPQSFQVLQPRQVPSQPKAPQWNVDRVPLETEKGANYTKLRDLLKGQKWKEADYETYRLMITIVGRKEGDYFRKEDLLNFPCKDLKTIDRLWVQASQGRYGFSVQKEIYVRCGAKLDGEYPGDEIWRKFGTEVGWRVNNEWQDYDDLTWNSIHVPGHLPSGFCVVSLLSHQDL